MGTILESEENLLTGLLRFSEFLTKPIKQDQSL